MLVLLAHWSLNRYLRCPGSLRWLDDEDKAFVMHFEPGKLPVSVAMATYNGERFIMEQLQSLASQTYLPMELVVSDDGSNDETLPLIESFKKTSPFEIRVLPSHKRLGVSDNFLHAAEQCRGSYIAFCDQDDKWMPHKLETQIGRILKDSSILAMHRLKITDADLKPRGGIWDQGIEKDWVFEPLELNPYCTGWGNSMLFDRTLVHITSRCDRPRQPEMDLPLSHDTWIYVLAAGLGKVSHILEPLLLYRQHGSNVYGVGPTPLSVQLRTAILPPQLRLQEEYLFDKHMAAIFEKLSVSQEKYSSVALAAAAAYRDRAKLCQFRTQTYKGETLLRRLEGYRMSRRYAFYKPSHKSSLKEAALGVLGFGRLFEPYLRRRVDSVKNGAEPHFTSA